MASTIRIEGSILTGDILDRISQSDIIGQKSKDFGFREIGGSVKDEIVRVWADAQDYWRIFQRHAAMVREDRYGTHETRSNWILPLLGLLGYRLDHQPAGEVIAGKNYLISHRDHTRGGFPVHIVGFKDSLDRKRPGSTMKMSPHGMVQEYLNLTEHLYAIVTNGLVLRLLRDSTRLVKLSYIEFDLDQMFRDSHFADFAILFRLLHASRMPAASDAGGESLIEQYHTDAMMSGSRIRDGLRQAVEKSIIGLANGFLRPENTALIDAVETQPDFARTLYQVLLRLIYRILFLIVIEERNLIYPDGSNREWRDIYYRYYSISRLRNLAGKPWLAESRYHDAWESVKNTFQLFEREPYGRPLGIRPLAGDLFGERAIGELHDAILDNKTLLDCLANLSMFRNPLTGQIIRVNYAALNVEEFGSVYEGLLEYHPMIDRINGRFGFRLVRGSDRAASGTHYTPDELVQPLIKHSLDHVIERKIRQAEERVRNDSATVTSADRIAAAEAALLSITVCDPACGSGHILLNAARRIAVELAVIRTGDDQPSPAAFRTAVRDVIGRCIYGVDINPLAVELCKVSLWLEAHNPGEPLNFLDHRIRCGDAVVGVATIDELETGIPSEAFDAVTGDDKSVAAMLKRTNTTQRDRRSQGVLAFDTFRGKNLRAVLDAFGNVAAMPERTPAEIDAKRAAYAAYQRNAVYELDYLADIVTAQFFIRKTGNHPHEVIQDEDYWRHVTGELGFVTQATANAKGVAEIKNVFHWFLEFPEVFAEGGFDCILGNPPFLGGQKISGTYGSDYLEYLKYAYRPARSADLVTYFFRRAFALIKPGGFQSLIAVNTIAQGGAREGGLAIILETGGAIHHAVRSMPWPGAAAVEVALVTVFKGKWERGCVLNGKPVHQITSYLDDSESLGDPFPLKQNENKSFVGSYVLGTGFILTPDQAQELIRRNPKNREVLFPYLNGDDLNSRPDQSPSRWVINFHDWPLDADWDRQQREPKGPPYASDYPECLEIVEYLIKSGREKNNRKCYRDLWWQYAEKRPLLYRTIAPLERVLVVSRVTKYLSPSSVEAGYVYSEQTIVLSLASWHEFSIVSSTMHEAWAWKYCSTMGGNTLRYGPSEAFENYPFPQKKSSDIRDHLHSLGYNYHESRRCLMHKTQMGLTKVYNQFHNPSLTEGGPTSAGLSGLSSAEIGKRFGKETWNLWRHLQKTPGVCGFDEAVVDILALRELHARMDQSVSEAYGWTDLMLRHDFYEVEYLPENDRTRFTIHPDVRREVLKRLLLLNHAIHAAEPATPPAKSKGRPKPKTDPAGSHGQQAFDLT